MNKYTVTPNNAERVLSWFKDRGGVAVWQSIDLSDPGAQTFTPAQTDGKPTGKPHWKFANEPKEILTDPARMMVTKFKEVRRFHVAVRPASNRPFSFKCTDASSRKIERAVEKAGEGATYEFDYETQDAVILVPDKEIPLNEWKAGK